MRKGLRMNQARMGLLVAAALLAVPTLAHAQAGKGKKPPAAAGDAKGGKDPKGSADPKTDTKGGTTMDADAPPADKKDDSKPADAAGAPDAPGDSKGICDIDPSQCPQVDFDAAAKRPIPAQMYAVQQIYALRVRRFELNPYYSFTLNDQFVSHNGPGLSLNYYIYNTFAIGLSGNYYSKLNNDSSFNAQTRRAARVAVPLTEYDWSASLNATWVPAYGKFAGFGDFIFHYDAYVVGGIGLLSDKPIAVIDPDNRTFTSKINPSFNAGIGLRIFFNRWFAAVLEVRDYVFIEKLENTNPVLNPADSTQWYASSSTVTNNVQAQIGVSIFLPFSWDYRLPK